MNIFKKAMKRVSKGEIKDPEEEGPSNVNCHGGPQRFHSPFSATSIDPNIAARMAEDRMRIHIRDNTEFDLDDVDRDLWGLYTERVGLTIYKMHHSVYSPEDCENQIQQLMSSLVDSHRSRYPKMKNPDNIKKVSDSYEFFTGKDENDNGDISADEGQ